MKYSKVLFLSLVLFACAAATFAQSTKTAPESKLFDAAQLLRDIQTLSADDMEGRSPRQPSIQKARDYVDTRFKDAGLEPIGTTFKQEFQMSELSRVHIYKVVNFVGLIKGKKNAEKYIVISAHYDHEGIEDGKIYNGADDNASGTAALFAIATHFKKDLPDHSLIFVAFDAEEQGLLGSRYFVRNLPVPKEAILLNVNMDMISRNDKGELYAVGTKHYPQFKPVLESVQKTVPIKLRLGHEEWTNQSDQAAFHAAKIPFIYFGVEDHKDYHKPTDDFAKIQPAFYVSAVETIIASIKALDESTK
jgi:Zn-dependent M28 family amino/carboxypeptidase